MGRFASIAIHILLAALPGVVFTGLIFFALPLLPDSLFAGLGDLTRTENIARAEKLITVGVANAVFLAFAACTAVTAIATFIREVGEAPSTPTEMAAERVFWLLFLGLAAVASAVTAYFALSGVGRLERYALAGIPATAAILVPLLVYWSGTLTWSRHFVSTVPLGALLVRTS